MHRRTAFVCCFAILTGIACWPRLGRASGINDYSCHLTPAHPRPVVLVHGRGGNIDGFGSLVATLTSAGYCVFGMNYGQTDGQGPYGHDHLTVSGAQIDGFIRHVLDATGANQVDVIGHSAGTGVLNNVILEKGDGYLIYRFVSFGGLHHPYAHAGASEIADGTLFLPNLIKTARVLFPDLTAQQLIIWAINTYAGAGGSLAGIDVETAESNFAADLFEPDYWTMLHGGLSEPPGTYILIGASDRSLPTHDSVPEVCYTNIVGIADLMAGSAAGFQDEAPNVENFLLLTTSDHVQMLDDAIALGKTLEALATPCDPTWPDDDPPDADDPPGDDVPPGGDDPPGTDDPPGGDYPPGTDDPDSDDGDLGGTPVAGCATSPPSAGGEVFWLLLVAAGLFVRRRRR